MKFLFAKFLMRSSFIALYAASRSLPSDPHVRWLYLPISMVSRTDMAKVSLLATGTYPICLAISLRCIVATSTPSISTFPDVGARILFRHFTRVDFPTPLGPIMQYSPGSSTVRLMSLIIGWLGLYPKVTFFSSTRVMTTTSSSCCPEATEGISALRRRT